MKTFRIKGFNTVTQLSHWFSNALLVVLTALLIAPAMTNAQSPATVDLGSSGDFVLLAGSLVSNVPMSAITGDLGLSPAAGSNITGFGEAEVTGTIYTVDESGPAGSVPSATMLSTAKEDIIIAYNDIVDRTPVPTGEFLNPGAGNIGGMTLVPGLYKFTSTLSITGSDVTLTGTATDVWIFQIASDLVVGSGIQVILAGEALAANIFWQVGTSATLETGSVFKGTILADQSISLNTGATIEGRLLASNAAVTLESSTVTAPGLVTAVEEEMMPGSFALSQNYPNPFNPVTMIDYQIPAVGHVTLSVFDVSGREVTLLVDQVQHAGHYRTAWDARAYASGMYFYRLQAGAFVSLKKMAFIK